jgi:hypothetical protein
MALPPLVISKISVQNRLGVTSVSFSSAEREPHESEQRNNRPQNEQQQRQQSESEPRSREQHGAEPRNDNEQYDDKRRKVSGRLEDLSKKKEISKEAEAEACDISRKSSEDIPPEPGNPDFWPSTDLNIVEDLEPPMRNKPDSSPWCDIQEAKEGQEKLPPKVEQPTKGEEGEEE